MGDEEGPYHNPVLFRVGDIVEVGEVPEAVEAWHVYREKVMQFGTKATIVQVDPLYGYLVKNPNYLPLWVPSCSIEKVKVIVPVITVPSWDAVGGYRA